MKTYSVEAKKKIIEEYSIPPQGVNCMEVLEKCLPVMYALCRKEKEPMEWMHYFYDAYVSVYFPGNAGQAIQEELEPARRFYLDVLQKLLEDEKQQLAFDRCRDFLYISDEELAGSEIKGEYQRFWQCFQDLEVYAFMRIARECMPFDTLGHIAGVHFVAMHIARQLIRTPVPIDLALISSASIIHDIGKFGCRCKEAGRVPYLHYYYTAQFAERFHFETIGHIAANHSTWDLELENLSVESLLLIYADFRVKSIWDDKGREKICFWTLDESYGVILSKLDNVDDKKRVRYQRVFQKLKDFEGFLISLGISVGLDRGFQGTPEKINESLLEMPEIVEQIKYRAIRSNLAVMHEMIRETSFVSLLEEAKSEKDWRNVRSYLNVLGEYSTYMTCSQKDVVIKFLYEMMMHRDGDIRRQAARITGRLISNYEVRYQKEIPEGAKTPDDGISSVEVWKASLRSMLIPDHKISERHRRWLGYMIKTLLFTVLHQSSEERKPQMLEVLLEYYKKTDWENLVMFLLMDCAGDLSLGMLGEKQRQILFLFAEAALRRDDPELYMAALRFLELWSAQGWKPSKEQKEMFQKYMISTENTPVCCRYLAAKLDQSWNRPSEELFSFLVDKERISLLFLENQRMDTPWIFKLVNLEILKECCLKDKKEMFQMAAHLVNMLQNSDRIVIKHQSGRELMELVPYLSEAEKYEIAMELIRGLEIGEYSVSKYIPEYMGKIFFLLSLDAQYEILDLFCKMVDSANPRTAIVTLETCGIILQYLFLHGAFSDWRRELLEGLLFRGMAHYLDEVSQEAFYIVGQNIFGSAQLNLKEKWRYFDSIGRKLLMLMNKEKNRLHLYNYAASLNHIYRFLSDYHFLSGKEVCSETVEKIAFFPGTFDPFSLGHKEIVKEIQKRGFRVYLALDEFSWSKKTQPFKIRRKILKMSVADMKDVYLFPEEIPINISNPQDLRFLKSCFPGKEVCLVAGSDVVEHASAYRNQEQECSVHHFPHIIFIRQSAKAVEELREKYRRVIHEDILFLTLPGDLEKISSTQIRDHVDRNRDISNLVDRNVQNYIYDLGLYTREPMFKFITTSTPVDAYFIERMDSDIKRELVMGLIKGRQGQGDHPDFGLGQDEVVFIRSELHYGQIIGAVFFHPMPIAEILKECLSIETAAYLRRHISGKIAVISGIYGRDVQDMEDSRQSALTEMLVRCASLEYTYVLCFGDMKNRELLLRQGFLRVPVKEECYLVDLHNPIVLFCDACMSFKEPFRSGGMMKEKMWEHRKRLQRAITRLYPGNLVLCIDSGILNHRLIKMITKENQVPMTQSPQRRLGEKMCVPFGRILRGMLVPNCVTKELETEKLYFPDMEGFEIKECPNCAALDIQIRTIKSFQRPVILVDDLYHKGYRMEGIDPVLKKEQIEISKIIVGVLSGNGKDLADIRGKNIDCVYFLPNMRAWFMESGLYPFVGGDSISKERITGQRNTIFPSINFILPYQVPHALSRVSAEGYYQFSELCLQNAEELMLLVEKEYQNLTGRKLTIRRLGEVMVEPRYPDTGMEVMEASSETPSACIRYERKRLKRLKHLTCLEIAGK